MLECVICEHGLLAGKPVKKLECCNVVVKWEVVGVRILRFWDFWSGFL